MASKGNVRGVHQNGVDRIDSRNRRYELSNCVTCCKVPRRVPSCACWNS